MLSGRHILRAAFPALADDRLTCSSAVLPPYSFCLYPLANRLCGCKMLLSPKPEVRFIHSHEDQFLIPSLDSGFREKHSVELGPASSSSPLSSFLSSSPHPVFSLNTKSLLQGGMLVNYNLFTYYALNLISPAYENGCFRLDQECRIKSGPEK